MYCVVFSIPKTHKGFGLLLKQFSPFIKHSSYNPFGQPSMVFPEVQLDVSHKAMPSFHMYLFSILQEDGTTSNLQRYDSSTVLLIVNENRKHQMCAMSAGVYVQYEECSRCRPFSLSTAEEGRVVSEQLHWPILL